MYGLFSLFCISISFTSSHSIFLLYFVSFRDILSKKNFLYRFIKKISKP